MRRSARDGNLPAVITIVLMVHALVALLCGQAAAALREPYRELLDWSSLPVLTSDRCVHVSSADPTGGNKDYGHFVRGNRDGSKVLADLTGPGCVTHLWLTASRSSLDNATLRFYFDGRSTPTINMGVLEFFDQSTPPFSPPLLGEESQSSGGYYSYVPMPFQTSCRVEVADLNSDRFYYNLDAVRYPPEDTVETFTRPLSPTRQALTTQILSQWNSAGDDPKGDLPGTEVRTQAHRVSAGQSQIFFELSGSGQIARLEVRSGNLTGEVLRRCWLQILWDGEEEPSVNAPLGDFFGTGPSGDPFRSLAFGRVGNELYSYFPMPYQNAALVRIQNTSDTLDAQIEMEVSVSPHPDSSGSIGRFFAVYNEETPADEPENYLLVNLFGAGHYVGTVLSVVGGSQDFYPYLEGDEMISVDGEATPSIQGTGTEDYFNGGWYYKFGEFARPVHGLPHKGPTLGETTQYRIHLLDKVPFSRRLLATMEHGANNTVRSDYRSVTFAYAIPREPKVLPAPTPTPTPEPGANLLANPGAERGMLGWRGGGQPAYAPQIDPETHIPDPPSRSGDHHFGLSVGWSTADCYQYQSVRVKAGNTYEAGMWFTRRNGTHEALEMLWIDGTWPGTEKRLYLSEGPEVASWTHLTGRTFIATQNQVTLVIRYRHPVASDVCSIHADDVYLKEAKPAEGGSSRSPR